MKWITSLGLMNTQSQASALGWPTGMGGGEGYNNEDGNTCTFKVDSNQCTKTNIITKKINE